MLAIREGMGIEDHQRRWTSGVRQWSRTASGPGYLRSIVDIDEEETRSGPHWSIVFDRKSCEYRGLRFQPLSTI